MQFKVNPYKHQLTVLDITKDRDHYALFWEMGVGKSGGVVNILRQKYYTHKKLLRTLILSPLITLENWKREFMMHSTVKERDIIVLKGTGKKRIKTFLSAVMDASKELSRDRIVIVNYEALQTKELVELFTEYEFQALVCDESHLLKNGKSKRAKTVVKLADAIKYKFILTGTPILNSSMDIFNQFRILDGGETFGKNEWSFRNRYFFDANAKWSGGQGYYPDWVERSELSSELNTKIYAKAMRIRKEECLDLPPLITEVLDIEMSKDQVRLYKEMKRDYITWIEGKKESDEPRAVIAQLAVTKALRLQQIVSGFVSTEDGDIVDLGFVPRLQTVKDLLTEITPQHKVIIWCSFKFNYKQLANLCDDLKIPYVMLTGEMNGNDKQKSIDSFETGNEIRVIIANRRAGGIGVNLVSASYSIVYSRNFSLGEEKQSEARNHRGGSERHRKITKIELRSPGTTDELVSKAIEGKQKISDLILDPQCL